MRDRQAYHNRLVVSALHRERRLNQEQPPDTLFYVERGDILTAGKRTEKEAVLAGGPGEPQRMYKFGGTVEGSITFSKLQPQHLAFLAAYALGEVSTTAAGSGYLHTITPRERGLEPDREVPTFTAVQRLGDSLIKRLYASLGIDSFSLSVTRDDWVRAQATLKGTGKTQINLVTEEVSGQANATSITLAANAVQGSTAEERLDSVHLVRFKLDSGGGWQPVQVTAVSDATPAVITIEPPGTGTDTGTYQVVYVPAESTSLATGTATSDPEYDYANATGKLTDSAATMTANEHQGRWLVMTSGTASGAIFQISANTTTEIYCQGYDLYAAGVRSGDAYKIVQFGWLPCDQAAVSEPPMRCDDIQVVIGGDYDGSSFSGGRRLGAEIESLEWAFSQSLEAPFLSGGTDYASALDRGDRVHTLRVSRRMMDAIYQAMLETADGLEAEYFGIRLAGEGPEYETGQTYYWEVVFPKCALVSAQPAAGDQRLTEDMEIAVLSHETHGSCIVKVRNKVATYAAA